MTTNTAANTAAIESLRSFALAYADASGGRYSAIAFAHMCTAALAGEEWAIERVTGALRLIDARSASHRAHVAALKAQAAKEHRNYFEFDATSLTIDIIRTTDTTRPDGATARALEV